MQSRRDILTCSLLLTVGGATPAFAQVPATPRALAERFAATLTAHDIDAFSDLFADDYANHQVSAAAPLPSSNVTPKQGSVGFFKARLAGLPDLAVSIETLVADDERVAASFVYSGTHRGLYLGVEPTGKRLRFTSCDIFRVQNGRFVEHWGMGDIAGILAQLRS